MSLIINGNSIGTDKEGFLTDLDDWSEQVAIMLAQQENIQLTELHWEIINLLRRFYQNYQLSPAMRPLVKFIAQELAPEKARSIYLLKLFPGSPAKLASKIAGLPRPDNCL